MPKKVYNTIIMSTNEKIHKAEVNPLHSEHLAPGEKPIIACVGTFEDFEGEFQKNVDNPENVDWFATKPEMVKKNLLNAGVETYVISPLDNKDKRSDGYSPCTGVIVVGRDKDTKENISFLTHQYFTKLSHFDFLPSFIGDLKKRLEETKERCIPRTIDVVVVGGLYNDNGVEEEYYKKAINVLSQNIRDAFGFEPVIITGPKTNIDFDEQEEDIILDTKNRRLYIARPVVGNASTESYLPSKIEEQEEKWKNE